MTPSIRPLYPGDLLAGRGQPKRELFLSTDGLSAQARPPTWTAFLPWGASGYGLVCETDTHGAALVYACAQSRRDKWDVVYLAGSADASDEAIAALWQSLLERLCQEAGRQGILRVFARLDEGLEASPEERRAADTFRRAGFVVYSHDRLWQREPGTTLPTSSEPVSNTWRPQRSAAAWGLHSLYRSLAPSLVQQSEGLTSRNWRPPGRRWFGLGEGPRGYVLTQAGEIKAHLCVSSDNRLRLLAHPDAREAVGVLLSSDLAELSIDPDRSATMLVPEYSGWVAGALEQAGFQHVGTHLLLVKHTVAWAREPEWWQRLVAHQREALEPAPTTPATSATNGEYS